VSRHLWKSSGRSTHDLDAVHRFLSLHPGSNVADGSSAGEGSIVVRRSAVCVERIAQHHLFDLQLISDFQ
jgi:hypothetical protein